MAIRLPSQPLLAGQPRQQRLSRHVTDRMVTLGPGLLRGAKMSPLICTRNLWRERELDSQWKRFLQRDTLRRCIYFAGDHRGLESLKSARPSDRRGPDRVPHRALSLIGRPSPRLGWESALKEDQGTASVPKASAANTVSG